MDRLDFELLGLLEEDSSVSVSRLASKLGVPKTTLFDRVKKLRKEGVIKKFTIVKDFEKLGLDAGAFIMVKFTPLSDKHYSQKKCAEQIAKLSGIQEVHIISGEYDIVVKAVAKNLKELGKIVVEKLREVPGVSETLTCSIFDTMKE